MCSYHLSFFYRLKYKVRLFLTVPTSIPTFLYSLCVAFGGVCLTYLLPKPDMPKHTHIFRFFRHYPVKQSTVCECRCHSVCLPPHTQPLYYILRNTKKRTVTSDIRCMLHLKLTKELPLFELNIDFDWFTKCCDPLTIAIVTGNCDFHVKILYSETTQISCTYIRIRLVLYNHVNRSIHSFIEPAPQHFIQID